MNAQSCIEDLMTLCHPRSLQRARVLASEEKNFMTRMVAKMPSGDLLVSGLVASSQGWRQHYKTSVQLADAGFIRDYRCTCPAFLNYDGPCKHCAALLMDYAVRSNKYQRSEDPTMPRTSRLVTDLMKQLSAEPGARMFEGSIELLPELKFEYDLWCLRMRIASPDASYVIRDLRKLVDDVRFGAKVAYGKKLTLTHHRGVFTKRSQQLIGLLETIMDQPNNPFVGWSYGAGSRREIDLSDRDMVDFLDIMEGATFTVESSGFKLPRRMTAQVVRENPPLEVRLVSEGEGYLLVRDTEAVAIVAGQRSYVLVDNTFFRCSDELGQAMAALQPLFDQDESRLYVSKRDAPLFCATLLPHLEAAAQVKLPSALEALRPVPGQLEFYFDKVDDAVEGAAQVRYGQRVYLLAGDIPESGGNSAGASAGAAGGDEASEAGEAAGADEAGKIAGADEAGAGETDKAGKLGKGSEAGEVDRAVPHAASVDSDAAPLRDKGLERVALELLREYFPSDFQLSLSDEIVVGDLLFGGLARFRANGEVFTTPAFDRLLTDRKPRFSLGISLSGDLLAMDVTAEDLPADELSALLASYKRKKRFHRLRSGAFVNVAAMDLHQLDVLMDDLGVTPEQLASGRFELPTYSAFFLDREFADAHRNVEFTDYVNRLDAIDPTCYPVPDGLDAVLRPYQLEGFRWLSCLVDMKLGGILADEMGLGKSLQLISLLQARRSEAREVGPSLIVCPASLVYNWAAEFQRFAPDMTVQIVAGTKRERERLRRNSQAEVLVTSYDLLRIDVRDYEDHEFFCCVLDEAQYIKNHATLTARAVKRVQARHRLALTGTPMENRLAELWSIFDFLMPGLLGSYARFRERYELGIVGGDEELSERLRRLVGPFILRRLKADVLTDLPDKLESVVRVELSGEQRKLYAASEQRLREELSRQKKLSASRSKGKGVRGGAGVAARAGAGGAGAGGANAKTGAAAGAAGDNAKPRVEVLAELMRLRQIALDPGLVFDGYRGGAAKVDAIMELVGQACESGQKMLLFSQFTTFLDEIAQRLDAESMQYYMLTGATPKKRRVQMVDAFNADDTPIFLISLKAGGTGLNLIGASMVVHADPWWNAAAQNQATDRAHRIGQQNVVNVYKVIAADTIEERILELQQKKTDLADAVVGAAGADTLSALTRDQLLELLE